MILNDIAAGFGVGVIDTHDLADELLDDIRRSRIKDVCLFNLLDPESAVGLNPFHHSGNLPKQTTVSFLIAQWRTIWASSWGPRLENTLRHACLALMDYPGASIADLRALLLSRRYRERILSFCHDDHVVSFWRDEFERFRDDYQLDAIAPILNKVDSFLASPLRPALCTRSPRLNLRRFIDSNGILLVPLNKGLLGEEAATFAGSVLLSQVVNAVLSRFDIPESRRRPWFIYLDEFIGNRLGLSTYSIPFWVSAAR